MALAADALVRAASGEAGAARGTVRITASEIIGAEVLPKILASFRERHPAVTIELVLSNRPEDLLRREVDIAVRMLRPDLPLISFMNLPFFSSSHPGTHTRAPDGLGLRGCP
jgi:DNA-binding transcriptional LysR family regulator